MTQFKVGDIVDWCGLRGIVMGVFGQSSSLPVVVESLGGRLTVWFTLDGKAHQLHTIPSLKLIERPKKRVKKKGWIAISPNVGPDGSRASSVVYPAKKIAESWLNTTWSVQEIEFEVEEE